MIRELEELKKEYEELNKQLSDPKIIADQEQFQKLARRHSEIARTVQLYSKYKNVKKEIEESNELKKGEVDEELNEMINEEIASLSKEKDQLEEDLNELLYPEDPRNKKDIIVEIRAGAGGDEAALFVNDLFRMYSRFAERNRWKVEIMNSNSTEIGGFKEIIFGISGENVFGNLKQESGVHRVQRIPVTESGGRIHTSTVTVAILPEAEDIEMEINPNDIKIDRFRSTGPGGQSVNTTDSAVRVTHIPTGIVVTCQDEKSQHKNKEKALKVLRARLFDRLQSEQNEKIDKQRKKQVGTGDRSERIRTYNFPQNRITDHRINKNFHNLEEMLDGNMDDLIASFKEAK
ncbi:MAG: peptide chain release factor 1 [Candidatus Caldatribacteriota bacterium]|jgi:peptide chain release factor 1|nr:peptide chain release factor 1 [Atribacterota bacterium]MDD3030942.1 peptide chain release factor 1 [Atribacterota bacterium]MDD3640670.1 peptide chain release factor 1 [Atribacterota bacterium]MDD4287984.1 peptide chain release factor 1 [Atribacterota bacterium]MDD4765007.1 peptide chain release factor 1 [Atribacterota bacterium]